MASEKEHKELKGFFEIPSYPFVYINKDGQVWDEYFKEYIRPKYSLFPYPEIHIKGSSKPLSLHRALALTFIDCPGDPLKFQVDHNDGNKENYSLSNLSWVTKSQNAVNAFKTGLRKDNKPVMLKDLKTGEIKEFYGVNECARELKIHPGYISTYLKRPQKTPFRGKYELIRKGDEWLGLTEKDIDRYNMNRPKVIVAYNVEADDYRVFESLPKASQFLMMTQSEIGRRASLKVKEPLNGYIFSYLDDFVGDLSKATYIKSGRSTNFDKNRYRKKPRKIKVTNLHLNEETHFNSVDEFANSLLLNKKTIQKSMKRSNGRYKHYLIEYI